MSSIFFDKVMLRTLNKLNHFVRSDLIIEFQSLYYYMYIRGERGYGLENDVPEKNPILIVPAREHREILLVTLPNIGGQRNVGQYKRKFCIIRSLTPYYAITPVLRLEIAECLDPYNSKFKKKSAKYMRYTYSTSIKSRTN